MCLIYLLAKQEFHHLASSLGHGSTGTEDSGYASLVKEVIVLCGDDTAGNDHDVFAAEFLQLFNQLRDEGLVTCGQRTGTDDIYVGASSLAAGGVWNSGPISTSKPQSA